MKFIAYILVFLMFLPVIYAPDMEGFVETYCSTAGFCGASEDNDEGFELSCEAFGSDGKCPEHYGDWSGCAPNNYDEDGKCMPCDPDCDNCGDNYQGLSIIVPNAERGDTITIETGIYLDNFPRESNFILRKRNLNVEDEFNVDYWENELLFGEADCMGLEVGGFYCNRDFEVEISNDYCEEYTFGVQFIEGLVSSDFVFDTGVVAPFIEITSPINEDVLKENAIISSNIICDGPRTNEEIFAVIYELCGDEDSCDTEIAYLANGNNYVWDTLEHDDGGYLLKATVISVISKDDDFLMYSVGDDFIDITLDNPIRSNYQGSKILNIVLAKIQSWL